MDSNRGRNIVTTIIGIIIGICYFIWGDHGSVGNSFLDECWKRKQPQWIVHNKAYIIGAFLVYEGWQYLDILLILIGGAWIGTHLSQDIAERWWESHN
jgi:hypothetical protein